MHRLIIFLAFTAALVVSDDVVIDLVDYCEDGWINSMGNCYLIVDDKVAAWDDAVKDCNNRRGDLIIIETTDELNWLVDQATDLQSDGFWTKLQRKLTDSQFYWDLSYPPDTAVVQWNTEPDNTNGNENCGAVNEQDGFSDEDCGRKYGFICERKTAGCPTGWLFGNDQCFYISDTFNVTQLMTWQEANQKCTSMAQNARLADISDPDAQDYLSMVLPEMTQTTIPWWVSLNRKNGQWFWGPNLAIADSVTVLSWLTEPNNLNGVENCGMMYANGKFADKDCDRLANYICKKTDNSVPMPYAGKFGCGSWTRAGDKCYYFQNDFSETRDDARAQCTERGGDLLKILSVDEKNYIEYMTRLNKAIYWTQLSAPSSSGPWTFADGSTPGDGLMPWNAEPNDYSGIEDCVQIYPKLTWNDQSCGSRTGYICEALNNGQACPQNWTTYGDSCYFFGPGSATSGKVNWYMARRRCRRFAEPMTGKLLSIEDPGELAFINQQITTRQSLGLSYWTGLNDWSSEGQYIYDSADEPPRLDLIPWDVSPSCSDCSPACAVLLEGGSYSDNHCTDKMNYICEKYAAGAMDALGGRWLKVEFLIASTMATVISIMTTTV